MRIVWDPKKNSANRKKHRLSFAQAAELFISGRDYLEIFDDAHDEEEDRFIAIGEIAPGVIVAVFTEPQDDVVRIISARRATLTEIKLYHGYKDRAHDRDA